MKLRIVGDAAPRDDGGWPEPSAAQAPAVVLHDARGGLRDRELLRVLRAKGVTLPVLLALEGAEAAGELEPELGPGRWVRGHGPALVAAVQRAAGARLALGGGAARAFRAGLSIRIDPGLRAGALSPMLRGATVDLTLREGWPGVLLPLIARASS